jgi:hypothetical protein
MSKKATTKRPSPRARGSAKVRTARSAAARQGGSKRPAPGAPIGNSLFTVRFKEIPGTEVFFSTLGYKLKDADNFYEQVFQAYRRLFFLVKGKPLAFNPLEKGLSQPTSIAWMFRSIKELLPRELQFNIDRGDEGYFLTLFRECDFQPQWTVFPVGPTLLRLEKKNPSLHRLFLSFLRSFSQACTINCWYEGMMCNSLESLDDNVLQMEGDSSPEEVMAIKDELTAYRQGVPAQYAKKIRKSPKMSPAELQRAARRFKAGEPISNLIYQGAELMKPGYNLYDYCYPQAGEDDYSCYLHLMDQAAIVWRIDDHLCGEHETYIDCDAQEGIMPPVAYQRIDRKTKAGALDDLVKKSYWPGQLQDFFDRANELIIKFNR